MLSETQPATEMTFHPKNLHQLVKMAAGYSMPSAVERNSFIVNEVSPEFKIATDEKTLAFILKILLITVVTHSNQSCIRVSAKEYDDIIFVSVKDSSSFTNNSVSVNLEEVQLLAKKMNASVSILSMEDKVTNIVLSFPNFPKAG